MIYTTYFAKLKKLPENIIPIAICGRLPDGLKSNCYHYKQLAPHPDFFHEYKRTGDVEQFTKCYKERVLDKLDPYWLATALTRWVGGKDIAPVCYEKPTYFCHRHFVVEWRQSAVILGE